MFFAANAIALTLTTLGLWAAIGYFDANTGRAFIYALSVSAASLACTLHRGENSPAFIPPLRASGNFAVLAAIAMFAVWADAAYASSGWPGSAETLAFVRSSSTAVTLTARIASTLLLPYFAIIALRLLVLEGICRIKGDSLVERIRERSHQSDAEETNAGGPLIRMGAQLAPIILMGVLLPGAVAVSRVKQGELGSGLALMLVWLLIYGWLAIVLDRAKLVRLLVSVPVLILTVIAAWVMV